MGFNPERSEPFRKLFATDKTMNAGIYNAALTAEVALQTGPQPTDSFLMGGFDGFELLFIGTDTNNDTFDYEIWYYYKIQEPKAEGGASSSRTTPAALWCPFKAMVGSDNTLTNSFYGVASQYITATDLFADYISTPSETRIQAAIEDAYGQGADAQVAQWADLPSMLIVPNVGGAHAVRVHMFEGASQAVTMNCLYRRTKNLIR